MTGEASAPASSANLGPGFDFLALALDIRCRVAMAKAEQWSVPMEARAIIEAVTASLGLAGPFQTTIDSDIPVGRGLGSSAALAAAAGAAAVRCEGGEPDAGAVFRAAAAADGHPDNAAAAVYGGLVAVAGGDVRRLAIAPTLIPIVAVPHSTLATSEARDALPETVPHAAAARSVARAAFLIEGLRTGDAGALAAAAGDELHEAPRARLSPLTVELLERARGAGALHASWSGAGPSVLALATQDSADVVARAMEEALGGEGDVLRPTLSARGLL